MNMEHGGHSEPDHTKHGGHYMGMAMLMTFTSSTQVTLLFSWWSTTTVTSYVLTLLVLFILVLLNRFLGILKLHLDQRPINKDHGSNEPPKLNLPPSRWAWNRRSKDRVSPLLPRMDENDDSERYGAFQSAPLLQPTAQISSDRLERRPYVDLQPLLFRSRRPWSWKKDGAISVIEGLRAFIGYALMLAVMTYNIGVLCAIIAGIVVIELLLGRFSPTSSGWQDGACHDG